MKIKYIETDKDSDEWDEIHWFEADEGEIYGILISHNMSLIDASGCQVAVYDGIRDLFNTLINECYVMFGDQRGAKGIDLDLAADHAERVRDFNAS